MVVYLNQHQQVVQVALLVLEQDFLVALAVVVVLGIPVVVVVVVVDIPL
jgi:hypothetical protein